MAKMLRHVKTGEIWPMNPSLSRHPDVEIFDQPDPQFAAAAEENATIGDLVGAEKRPAVAEGHEFEDVPDFVPSPETPAEEPAKPKKPAAKRKKAAKKKPAAAPVEEPAPAATDDDTELSLDDFELDMGDMDE